MKQYPLVKGLLGLVILAAMFVAIMHTSLKDQDNVYILMTRAKESQNYGSAQSLEDHWMTSQLSTENGVEYLTVRSVSQSGGNMTTVGERAKFQQSQVDKFCAKHDINSQGLPSNRHDPVYRHLLLNSNAKTLFCYVPKAGCTNLKVLYFIAQGLLPPSMAAYARVEDRLIKDIVSSHSLVDVNKETRDLYVSQYFKFMMCRHPLERLASAYRDKVHKFPLKGLGDSQPHYNWLRKRIYRYVHPREFRKWYRDRGSVEVNISFTDFITYWLGTYETQTDEHLRPIIDLCAPCSVRYDYYGNFDTFEQDARVLVKKVGATMANLRQTFHPQNPLETSSIARHLYRELSEERRFQVLERLSTDIDFYYHLFPYKRDAHKDILNISNDL